MFDLIIGFIEIGVAVILIEFNYMFNLSLSLLIFGGFHIGKRILSRKGKLVMSEEERKAIEDLKILCDEVLKQDNCDRYDNYSPCEKMKMVDTVLNYIEELENKIPTPNNEVPVEYQTNIFVDKREVVMKDKIRDKIKELENMRNTTITSEGFNIFNGEIVVLKELLEENK